ncbi:MAG TPA: hypothetical protein VFN49_12190 [Candidatus Aquilonibacter sp.]|nr:hypothetical protein [Candidatus Aquilonibacter sp.]
MLSLGAIVLAVTVHTGGLTGALYAAGGGAGNFSTVRALNAMLGEANVQAELQHLEDEYGDTSTFVETFDFAMNDAWSKAGKADVSIRTNRNLSGQQLANAVISAGTQGHHFTVQRLLSALFPPQLAAEVLLDIDVKYGRDRGTTFRKVADAFFEDTQQLLASR